jgi:malto-oligosyltrehalose trehalohydrolase
MRRHHELPFGAELVPDGVRFRLWAPRAKTVSLILDDRGANPHPNPPPLAGEGADRSADRPLPRRLSNPPPQAGEGRVGASILRMRAEGEGWWSVTTGRAGAGSRYRYRVDALEVPDPASRFQPDGVHAASEVVDPDAYRWSDAGWRGRAWEELVIYELHLGAFSESGDCAGAVARLDDLVELGVTAVELMPIAAFPGRRNWGYDGVQLFAPCACYGRSEALKALVEACHERGLAILLDVVYNHFGPEGNYLYAIAPDFFTEQHRTPWGAAINYDGPGSRAVRDFMVHNALYWLEEYHFDGLRFDAVHAIADDGRPDILTELAETARERVPGRALHLVLENDKNEARRLARRDGSAVLYSAQWNDDVHHALHVLATGQTSGYYADYAERPIVHLGRALAGGFAYQGEPSLYRGGEPRGEPSGELPATAFVSFVQNHDQVGNTPFGERITVHAPEKLVHAAAAIVLLSPQIPLLFMGEEWATAHPFLFFCDFAPQLAEAVRQGRRREFAGFAEFREAAAQDRIPDATAETSFLASRLDWSERAAEPHRRWLDRYRRLLAVRSRAIAPRLPGMTPGGEFRELGPAALRVEWRLGDGARLLLLANFADAAVQLAPPAPSEGLLYCTEPELPDRELAAGCAAFFLTPADPGAR